MVLGANPLINPSAFDQLIAAGTGHAGIARLMSGGNRPYKWDIKDPAGSEGSTSTYRGWKVSDGITFRFEFWQASQIDDFFANYLPLLQYDASKQNPKPVDVYHPVLAANGIFSITTDDIGPLTDVGNQLWTVTIKFNEFRPNKKKNATTTPKDSKTAGKNAAQKPTVEDEQDRQIAALLEQWKKPLPGR